MSTVLIMAIVTTLFILFPFVGSAAIGLIISIQILLLAIRTAVSHIRTSIGTGVANVEEPVFSVHVAIHNEPPDMVEGTLRALAAQDWNANDYEVIVVDNNTEDPEIWRPVQRLCKELGETFKFVHRMGVTGAKAGALNIALARTRGDATHVVTVDADYIVDADFLTDAAISLGKTGADYVQFPQAYSSCNRIAAGVDTELEEYFRNSARMADGCEAVLLTGTLCVISKKALAAVGGWSGLTTTEDAEMGVRLCLAGYCGRFIDRVVGRGYLPFSLRDLERQRYRWAGGNLKTLMIHAPALLVKGNGLSWRRRGAIVSQLSAWLNLSLVPASVLIASVFLGADSSVLVTLAAISILLTAIDVVFRLLLRGRRDCTRPEILAGAIANRLALAPVSALATFEAVVGRPMQFNVTNKTKAKRQLVHNVPLASLTLFGLACLSFPAAMQADWITMTALSALMLPLPAACVTALTLHRYRSAAMSHNYGALA